MHKLTLPIYGSEQFIDQKSCYNTKFDQGIKGR